MSRKITRRAERAPAWKLRSSLLSGRRRWFFRAILVLFSFMLLALCEGGLRLLHLAAPESLIVRVKSGPFDVYQVNSNIGRRYFPAEMERIMPAPGFRIFPVRKEPGTVRIFVLGESSAAGFPYHTNGAFSGYLEDRLTLLLPGRRFEVINCALTAISSYAARDFLGELGRYQPDLFILYLGHNEYYGALGPASKASLGRAAAAPALRWLLQLRISRVLQSGLRRLHRPAEAVKGKTVMEAMTGQTGIRPGDAIDRAAREGFARNLRAMVQEAHGVPLLLCEQVCNLRDLPPFQSTHAPALARADERAFAQRLAEANRLQGSGDLAGALAALDLAVRLDSTFAGARFLRGRALLALGRVEEARRDFQAAREWDGIPFRAPERIGAVLRQTARPPQAWFVPVAQAFSERAKDGIPGNDLFFEHVHPRPAGQQLIATTILHFLCDHGLVAPAGEWRWAADPPPGELPGLAGLTPLDEEIADQRIFRLAHKWPFPENTGAHYTSARDPVIVELAQGLLDHRWDLVTAHLRLGRGYLQTGNLRAALPEYLAVCKIFPVVPDNFAAAAQILVQLGETEKAYVYIDRALRLDPGNASYQRLRGQIRPAGPAGG